MYKKIILFSFYFSFNYASHTTFLLDHIKSLESSLFSLEQKQQHEDRNSFGFLKQKHDLFSKFLTTASKFQDSEKDQYVLSVKNQLLQIKNEMKQEKNILGLSEHDDPFSATKKVEDLLHKYPVNMHAFESSIESLYQHFNRKYNRITFAALIDHEQAAVWLRDLDPERKNIDVQAMAQFALEDLNTILMNHPAKQELEAKMGKLFEQYFFPIFPYCWKSKFAKNMHGEIEHDTKNTDINNKYSIAIHVDGNSELKYTARINLIALNNKSRYELLVKKYGNIRWERSIPLVEYNWEETPMISQMSILANGMCSIKYGNKIETPNTATPIFRQYITKHGQALKCIKL